MGRIPTNTINDCLDNSQTLFCNRNHITVWKGKQRIKTQTSNKINHTTLVHIPDLSYGLDKYDAEAK
jgi:hypothetical protein